MSAMGGRVLALLLIAQACTPNPQELARAARASDSLTIAFADSAARRALAAEPRAPTVPDYVVRAVLERPRMLPFVFEGHARSIRRQAELLRALRSLSIAERAWIRSELLQ
jgi:hypothetical protein